MDNNREIIELKKRLVQFDEVIKMTQNLNSELQKKNENLEIENRTLEEDYHTVKDNYENLKKRFENLQKEVNEIKSGSKKSSMFSWIMSNGQKEENDKFKEKVNALEMELHLKIQENEQIHIEIFEERQNFKNMSTNLESEIEKMKLILNDKVSEVNSVNDRNSILLLNQRNLELSLNNITELLKKTQTELKENLNKWKTKKTKMKKEIESKDKVNTNLINVNDYNNTQINSLNLEYIQNITFTEDLLRRSFKLITNFTNESINVLNATDCFFESLIERLIFIYSNIDLKNEHRGYLFACDKIKFHSFTLSQIIKSSLLFLKVFKSKMENANNSEIYRTYNSNLEILINIILTLLNKSTVYIALLFKYLTILLKEERKISINEEVDLSLKQRINKDLKNSFGLLSSSFNLLMKKVNILTDFDLDYNYRNIQIVSDHTSGMIIKVNKNYLTNYKFKHFNINKHKLLQAIIKEEFVRTKLNLSEFTKHFILKTEIDLKMFELIKEENKSKFNFPIINLSVLKSNNENLKTNMNNLNEAYYKLFQIYENSVNTLSLSSWEFEGPILLRIFLIGKNLHQINLTRNKTRLDYSSQEEGVEYYTALRNKSTLKEMLEKESSLSRDRENYLSKLNEYEADLKRYQDKVSQEKNLNELLRLEMSKEKESSNESSITATSECSKCTNQKNNSTESNCFNIPINELEEFLKNRLNLNEISYETLSDDVQSGKQRSSFKLSDPGTNKAIPLTKFTAQAEKEQDVSVLYHRRMIETMQRYAAKIKSLDIKVMSTIQHEQIQSEYENKQFEVEKKYKEQVEYLTLQLEQKDNNIFGYTQTIEFLSVAHTSLEELKENVRDCNKCKKYIQES